MTFRSEAEHVARCAQDMLDAYDENRLDDAMIAVNALMAHVTDATYELVREGVQDGMTQRRMAALLGIPESALRGARREMA
jgi:hypothetical protein